MSRSKYFWTAGFAVVFGAFSLVGCSNSTVARTLAKSSGSAGPEIDNPKEKLDEERYAQAVRGLSFKNGMVVVAMSNQVFNRRDAVRATAIADQDLQKNNTWFQAAGLFRDAILLDPSYAPPYEGLSRSLMLEGKIEPCEAALRTAVKLDPNFDTARFELGTVLQMKGDDLGCMETWKDLAKRNPDYPEIMSRLAIMSYYAHDYVTAENYLAEADKRHQDVPSQFRPLLKEAMKRS